MTFLRNVWADLVEKRLWPLVVVLGLALVAVPVVLARSGGSTPAPPPLPPAPATASAGPAGKPIRVIDPTTTRAPHGRYRDPFSGHAAAKTAGASSSSSSAPAASSGASSSSSSSSSSSAPAGGSSSSASSSSTGSTVPSVSSGPATSTTSKPSYTGPQPVASGYSAGYRVGVGFGPAGKVEPAKDILRLHPMGADGKPPLVIFVGILADGKTAMFLLDAKADATGDGRCWPTKVTCQLLELRKGDAEFFDVPSGGSGVVQYELDVNTIAKRYTATRAGASHVRRRVSPSGRRAMRAVIKAGHTYVARLSYSPRKGVLFMPRRTGKTGGPSA